MYNRQFSQNPETGDNYANNINQMKENLDKNNKILDKSHQKKLTFTSANVSDAEEGDIVEQIENEPKYQLK